MLFLAVLINFLNSKVCLIGNGSISTQLISLSFSLIHSSVEYIYVYTLYSVFLIFLLYQHYLHKNHAYIEDNDIQFRYDNLFINNAHNYAITRNNE